MKMIIHGSEVSFDDNMLKEIGDSSFQLLIKGFQVFLLPCFPNAKDSHRSEDFPMVLKGFAEAVRKELGNDSADIEFTGHHRYNGILLLPEERREENDESGEKELREKRKYDIRNFRIIPAELTSRMNFRVTIEDQVGIKEDGDPLYSVSFEKNMTQMGAVTILKETVEQHPEGRFDESDLNFFSWISDDRMYHSLIIQRLDR